MKILNDVGIVKGSFRDLVTHFAKGGSEMRYVIVVKQQTKKEKEILSNAYKESQKIRGEADAKAIKIYADAYNKDPDLYEFLRSLDAYEKVFDPSTRVILSTDNEFLKYLK